MHPRQITPKRRPKKLSIPAQTDAINLTGTSRLGKAVPNWASCQLLIEVVMVVPETIAGASCMATGSSPHWQWIVIALLVLSVIGYIWTLQ